MFQKAGSARFNYVEGVIWVALLCIRTYNYEEGMR